MRLNDALRLDDAAQLALVGAGGKTTVLFLLAREFGGRVIVTTTTRLGVSQAAFADHHIIVKKAEDLTNLHNHLVEGVTLVTGVKGEDDKLQGLNASAMNRLKAITDHNNIPLLIEADGARQKPLKAPMEHEPVIPDFVEMVIVVAGLSGIGKPLNEEWVHRPDQFAALSGLKIDEIINPEDLSRVLNHSQGGLKNIPAKARKALLLNQAHASTEQAIGKEIAAKTLDPYDSVLVCDLKLEPDQEEVVTVFEKVAGIVLAAGGSRRLGEPKQLLDWHGEPFVRHVAKQGLAAGLSPVIVVTGAYEKEIKAVMGKLPAKIVHNPDWESGQSTSVKTGLHYVPRSAGAAIFLLVDQPQVSTQLVRKLVDTHARSHAPIVAPQIAGQRGNPILFDRVTFSDFEALIGDKGGRQIISKHKPTWVPWHDEGMIIDVDTMDDYNKLLDQG